MNVLLTTNDFSWDGLKSLQQGAENGLPSLNAPSTAPAAAAFRTEAIATGKERHTAAEAAALDAAPQYLPTEIRPDPGVQAMAAGSNETAATERAADAAPTATRRAVAGYESEDFPRPGGGFDQNV